MISSRDVELLLSRAPLHPYEHQIEGVYRLTQLVEPEIGRTIPGCMALFDEMGAGKTKQICDAAQVLYERGEIDTVLVIGPRPIRDVWFDPNIGEIGTHRWPDLPVQVYEFHEREHSWMRGKSTTPLLWIVTNLEYVRGSAERLRYLQRYTGRRTWLVVDESSSIKTHSTLNAKTVEKLRTNCGRVTILNGTPITNNVGDLYSQAHVLDPRILGYKNYWQFRANHAVLGGWQNKQILSWRGVEELQRRMAPYVIRRLKHDCLDLPGKLPSVSIPVPMRSAAWKLYREMRDDAVAWLSDNLSATVAQAAVKVMRLAQITSGFLGGLRESSPCELCEATGQVEDDLCQTCGGTGSTDREREPEITGTEKLDAFEDWLRALLEQTPNAKTIVWCRFRHEMFRVRDLVAQRFPAVTVGLVCGGQPAAERTEVLASLHPRSAPAGPVLVAGIPASGSVGLNLAAAWYVAWLSHGTSLKDRLQADDRVDRPGQVNKVYYCDFIATGPDGQRTVDHKLIAALRKKEDVAEWTCAAWLKALTEEE